MIEKGDLITFADGEKVVVLDTLQFEGNNYAFVNQATPDATDVTDVYYLMECNKGPESMREVKDQETFDKVLPLFSKRIEDVINNVLAKNAENEGQQ